MDQQLVTTLTDTDGDACGDNGFNMPNPTCMQKILIDQHAGSILAGGTNNPIDTTGSGGAGNTGYDWANEYNMIQQYAIKNSRLHIPLIFGVDAVHGFGHPWQAPLYPQSIGMGATWDPAQRRSRAARPPRARCARPAGTGTSPPCRTWPATTGGAAPTRPGPRSRRWRRRWAPRTSRACSPVRQGARRGRDGQALRRLLAVDQRPRPQRGAAAAELPAERDPAVLRRWDRRRRADGDGRLRLDQRRSGDRVALPADRHPARARWASRAS